MPLKNCPECNKEVSDRAASCPHCGCPLQEAPQPEPPLVTPNFSTPPSPPTKKKRSGCLIPIIVFLLIGCLAVLFVPRGSNSTQDASQAGESSTAADSASDAEQGASIFAVGDTVSLGEWEITLDAYEVVDSIAWNYGTFTPDEGDKYVVAHLTVRNNGTNADTFLPTYPISFEDVVAKILYQDTYEFTASRLLGYDADIHDHTINPLSTNTGIVAFSVVEDAALADGLILNLSLGLDDINFALGAGYETESESETAAIN